MLIVNRIATLRRAKFDLAARKRQRWSQRHLVLVLTRRWRTATTHERSKMIKLISLKF
jgi:hypothetical protein